MLEMDSYDMKKQAFVSVITVAELHVGVRNGKERTILTGFLDTLKILPLDAETAAEGGLLRRDYGPSHGVGLNDALIAATAIGTSWNWRRSIASITQWSKHCGCRMRKGKRWKPRS